MRFKEELAIRSQYVEELLREAMPARDGYQKTVIEAMEYALLAGGKRIRPILLKETYHMFGGNDEAVIRPFMAALEMIHTYSLVHDDLPSMDDDDTRRGRKTAHIVFGEAMALLAGDSLLNYAFETACRAFDATEDKEPVIRSLKALAGKAGVFGMIGGQVVDVETSGRYNSLEMLHFIYENKTSALLEAAMMIGAILGGGSEDEVRLVEKVAKNIGIAFQIKDDVLDVTSTNEVLGKPVHSDEKNEKTTYVTLNGLERSKDAVREYTSSANQMLKSLPYKNEFLCELVEWLVVREK